MTGEIPMADVLGRHARVQPTEVALRCGAAQVTFAELDERASTAAAALRSLGVRPHHTVGIALPNGIDFLVTAFAAWKCGASPLPLSHAAPTGERDELLRLADAVLMVGEVPSAVCPVVAAERLRHAEAGLPASTPVSDQPWKVIGSGGSTGRPKLIVAGHPAVVDPAVPRYTIIPGDTVFVPGPLYHQGPFIFTTAGLFQGNTVVMMERFDAAEALDLMSRHRVTWAYLVPTMTQRIQRLPDETRARANLEALRLLLSTGAPWPAWLKAEWIDWLGGERILEFYGGTEEQGGLSITGTESSAHPGAIGKAGDDVRVVDAAGADLPVGEVGELIFRRRAHGSRHYLGADNTEIREGWRSYGDLASIDEHGYVHIADRRTDLIVSGGVNLYPAEIEAALESHPAVHAAVVIGLPDEEWGQRAHAIVEVVPGIEPTWADLVEHLRGRLSAPKIPRGHEFVTTRLRDDAGKVRRSRLRDERIARTAVEQAQATVEPAQGIVEPGLVIEPDRNAAEPGPGVEPGRDAAQPGSPAADAGGTPASQ